MVVTKQRAVLIEQEQRPSMSSLRRTMRRRHIDELKAYNRDRPRRNRARSWAVSADLPEVVQYFDRWRETPSWRVVEGEGDDGFEQLACLCAKRGNVVFNHAVESSIRRLEMETAGLPPFFDELELDQDDFYNEEGRRARTPMLFLCLTAHDAGSSLTPAWRELMPNFNKGMSRLRRHYRPGKEVYEEYVRRTWDDGSISQEEDAILSDIAAKFVSQRGRYGEVRIFRSTEAHEDGFPHIHVILHFLDADFGVWEQTSKRSYFTRYDGSAGCKKTYRVTDGERAELLAALKWPWNVDVLAIPDPHSAVRYVAKYLTKTYADAAPGFTDFIDDARGYNPPDWDKGLSTMAVHSLMAKRAMGGLGAFIQGGLRVLRRRLQGAGAGSGLPWWHRLNELDFREKREGFELRNAVSSRPMAGESEGEEDRWHYVGMAEQDVVLRYQRSILSIRSELGGEITAIALTGRPRQEEMYRTAEELRTAREARERAHEEAEARRRGAGERELARMRIRRETGMEPSPDLDPTDEEEREAWERNEELRHRLRWERLEAWVRENVQDCRDVPGMVRYLMKRKSALHL